MATRTLNNVVIQLRNDTATNWATSTYQAAVGELLLDTTNNVIRIGDGSKTFSQLPNAGRVIEAPDTYTAANGGKDRTHGAIKVDGQNIQTFELTIADTSTIGAVLSQAVDSDGYATISGNKVPGYITVAADGKMTVKIVAAAEKLYTPRTISFAESTSGAKDTDATGSFVFDGSANVNTQLTLVDKYTLNSTEQAAGYARVTVAHVDAKGRTISSEALVSTDISDRKAAGAADDADATAKAVVAGKAIVADADGKLADSFLHNTGITANTGTNDAMYVAVKVDTKGRVVEAVAADDVKATDKNTNVANAKTSTLGLVTSDFDENKAANSDDNKGKVAIDADGKMSVTRVEEADKFHTARTIKVEAQNSGATRSDVTGSVVFDGSQDVSFALQLNDQANVTLDSGKTYQRITVANVNKQGLVVNSEALVSTDISDRKAAGAADDADAAAKAVVAGKAIVADTDGKLADSFLHAVTRTNSTDNTSTTIVSEITTDAKGRITAVKSIDATVDSTGSADAGKLIKLNSAGKLSNSLIPELAIGEVSRVTFSGTETVGQNGVTKFRGITAAQSGDIVVIHTEQGASESQADYEARRVTNGDK